ncbi:hypothetical protein ACWX0K_14980 [Nitrobacteraceae bacterium UC4446_H13]
MWARPEYSIWSPGADSVAEAVSLFDRTGSLYDFGSGKGIAVAKFRDAGFAATGIDHVKLTPDTIRACLWSLPADLSVVDFGFCADVMEHIPLARVDDVLSGIAQHVSAAAYFRIATVPDAMGKLIGETLHLTVCPAEWWLARVSAVFNAARIVRVHPNHVVIMAAT